MNCIVLSWIRLLSLFIVVVVAFWNYFFWFFIFSSIFFVVFHFLFFCWSLIFNLIQIIYPFLSDAWSTQTQSYLYYGFPKIVHFLSKQLACATCGSCKHSCQLSSLTDFWSRWLPWKRSCHCFHSHFSFFLLLSYARCFSPKSGILRKLKFFHY